MAETLSFAVAHNYDTRKVGITIDVVLRLGGKEVEVVAKLDTGASFCIFRRIYGELFGLTIESGQPETLSTPTGSFLAYGHDVTLIVLGLEFQTKVYFAADENFTRNVLGSPRLVGSSAIGVD
jgi:hypothetical protein